jgi:superfamily I DNA/RNA helicase
VYETKGLEFDVVILPDLGAFDLENEIGLNQAYVAISRPKHALFIGCNSSNFGKTAISILVGRGLLRTLDIK